MGARPGRRVTARWPVALVAGALLVAGCGGADGAGDAPATRATAPRGEPAAQAPSVPSARPQTEAYEPEDAEQYLNGKRLAARVAQKALTYGRGTSPRELAATLGNAAVGRAELARALEPAVDPAMRSAAEVVYPQLAGVTETSLGAMVVVRQRLQDAEGEWSAVTRVVDVRLRRSGGPWSLDRVASVGGTAVERPSSLPEEARRVLGDPNISLSDSARWDIYRGEVDRQLLRMLDQAAEDHEFAVGVLSSGHPRNVWATGRASAHSKGAAADIYAVDGQLVLRQRRPGSAAHRLARMLFEKGARQVGSPWVFPGAGRRSFSDRVHQDHIHVQAGPA